MDHDEVWRYFSNIPDTFRVFSDPPNEPEFSLKCHVLNVVDRSTTGGLRNEYLTWVNHGPQPDLNNSIAIFRTSRLPKMQWIKVFLQAFGFDIVGESDSQPEMYWTHKLRCLYSIQVEVRA